MTGRRASGSFARPVATRADQLGHRCLGTARTGGAYRLGRVSSPTDLPFGVGSSPDGDQVSANRLHEEVEELLTAYGLEFTTDAEGDYTFEVSEQRLYIKVNEEDNGFVRVFGQWRMVDGLPGGPLEWYDTAARVTMEIPLVKVMVVPDGLIVACDACSPPGGRLDLVLRLCIENVLHGVNHWHEYLFESAPAQPAGTGRHRSPVGHPEQEQGEGLPSRD